MFGPEYNTRLQIIINWLSLDLLENVASYANAYLLLATRFLHTYHTNTLHSLKGSD